MKSVNKNTIDETLCDITNRLQTRATVDEADRCVSPLYWYINTGRAPTDFLRLLVNAGGRQRESIAERLAKPGSYEAAVNSVCQCLGFIRHRV